MMRKLCDEYLRPKSVEQALEALTGSPGLARLVAGGTDLLLDIEQGRHPPVQRLIDISGVPEMNAVQESDGQITFGAAIPLRKLVQQPLIRTHAMALAEAGELIGGPQVRSVATLGGNVAHALPAGDGTIALLALGAEAQLASPSGVQWVPVETLFHGPGEPSFDQDTVVIVAFRVTKIGEGEASAFERVMRPQGVAIAILNMAAWVRCTSNGTVEDVRLAVGPAGPRPLRAHTAEAALRGQPLNETTLGTAREALLGEVHLRSSPHRATSDYRQILTGVLLERTLGRAHSRALPLLAPQA
jgi:CO/xanthine dehydrogenase FAD-binding subunit